MRNLIVFGALLLVALASASEHWGVTITTNPDQQRTKVANIKPIRDPMTFVSWLET